MHGVEMSTQTYARIAGTGSYLPERILTNAEMETLVETTDEWIRERTGIRQRHIAASGQTTGDLAFEAAKRALDAAGVEPGEIDLIVLGTTTPDIIFPVHRLPAAAPPGRERLRRVRRERGLFRVHLCARRGQQFHSCRKRATALVVGAETLTRMLDWSDRGTCVLFGDGAGAVVLKASDEPACCPHTCTRTAATRNCSTTRSASRPDSPTSPTMACACA
jgi:3-oxoacyl-[acyl-carrier-protein] synthase-3